MGREHCSKSNFLQLSHSMFCKNVARLAIARNIFPRFLPKISMFWEILLGNIQNILGESCSKFDFEQCSLKKSLKILIFKREYMEMCFHGNQLSWGIKHPLISLWSKYCSPGFIRLSTVLAPVISSLDEIYCTTKFTLIEKKLNVKVTLLHIWNFI